MRYSPEPTDWIVTKVQSNAEYDTIDFALVHLTPELRHILECRLIKASAFAGDPAFNHINYDYDKQDIKFYNWDEESDDFDEIREIIEEHESCFVSIADDFNFELNFTEPEQELDAHNMRAFGSNAFMVITWDDRNGDEYYTGTMIV